MGTVTEAATRQQPAVSDLEQAEIKYAMLSVYYASSAQEFAISGAPSVFVPPEVTPQPLAAALELISSDEQRLEQALWLIIRNTPVRDAWSRRSLYPREIRPYLTLDEQQELDQRRREYRRGASLFAAGLTACRNGDREQFEALTAAMASPPIKRNDGFVRLARLIFDQNPDEYLATMSETAADTTAWRAARERIAALESEVGLLIDGYVDQLAATAAYERFVELLDRRHGTSHPAMAIYPVSSTITQSTGQLWTSATVTTLAHGDFATLYAATDPANWHVGNDVIATSYYVGDPLDLTPVPTDLGDDGRTQALVYEEAGISWGRGSAQQGTFRNVLNVKRRARHDGHRSFIDINFSLCRSISSQVLWDSRRGGIMLNEGYLRVRPLGGGRWRITSRKLLRFSDRTPYSGASGWADFGQMLNYLAPTALSWWVETETYSLGQRTGHGQPASPPPGPAEQ